MMQWLKRVLSTNYHRCPHCGDLIRGTQKAKAHVKICKKDPPRKKTGLITSIMNLFHSERS